MEIDWQAIHTRTFGRCETGLLRRLIKRGGLENQTLRKSPIDMVPAPVIQACQPFALALSLVAL